MDDLQASAHTPWSLLLPAENEHKMKTTVNVMDIAELPSHEMLSILRQGSVLRLPHLEGRLRRAQEIVHRFESLYGTTLDKLLIEGLPDDADYQAHEDFIDWEYWQEVARETENVIKNIKRILEQAEDSSVLR